MSFLLDTNVISEWVKPAPDPNVIDWMAAVDDALFIPFGQAGPPQLLALRLPH